MGRRPPVAARDTIAEFIRNEATEVRLHYDWIRDRRFYDWLWNNPEVDFGEGVETITVFIVGFGREGH